MPADLSVLAVLQHNETFSAAARSMGVAHTTVSRKIRELEAFYGARLIERIGDRVALTREGEQAASAALRIKDELLDLERCIKGRDGRLYGQITLTTVDILAWRFMPILRLYGEKFPEIELTLSVETEVRSLSRREAEVAIRLTNAPEDYLFGNRLGSISFVPYASQSICNAMSKTEALRNLPWLGYASQECGARAAAATKAYTQHAVTRGLLPSPLMMLRAVQEGMGIGLLPAEHADHVEGLVKLSNQTAFELNIWMLTPRELRHTARIRALFDLFMTHAQVPDLNAISPAYPSGSGSPPPD